METFEIYALNFVQISILLFFCRFDLNYTKNKVEKFECVNTIKMCEKRTHEILQRKIYMLFID